MVAKMSEADGCDHSDASYAEHGDAMPHRARSSALRVASRAYAAIRLRV
jgi:hypothetical protein